MSTTQTATEATPVVVPATTTPASRKFRGDDILVDADTVYDQKRTIHARPEDIWPWLVQWGKGRGGWYVPARFEKVLPEKMRSAPVIDPKWQTIQLGDKVGDFTLTFGGGSSAGSTDEDPQLEVVDIETNRALVYRGTRLGAPFTLALLLENINGTPASSRTCDCATETVLHLRFRGRSPQTGWKAKAHSQVAKIADGFLASAMLPGIVDRAEQHLKTKVYA